MPTFIAHYLNGRQRILVWRLQDTFQVRSEWSTWLLIACLYGGWAPLASQHRHWDWPVLAGLVPFASLCISLRHESIHGHPTRWPRSDAVPGYLPLAVWYPCPLYRDSHLRHRLDERPTYPGLDPESHYVSLSEWSRLGSWRRRWLCLNKTLLGRATLNPLLALATMAYLEGSRLRQGEGTAWRLWGLRVMLLGGLLAGFWRRAGIPSWLYLSAVACPALGLSMLRFFYERRPTRGLAQRNVLVEAGRPWRLLFLNSNLYLVRHDLPGLPWYLLSCVYNASRRVYRRHSGGFHLPGCGHLWRCHGWRPAGVPVHPEH